MTSKQKAQVRKYAQNIKATFQIGAAGLTPAGIKSIDEGFSKKEVLKVKVNREDKFDKEIVNTVAKELSQSIKCEVAGIVGTTIILYKENDKIEKDNKVL